MTPKLTLEQEPYISMNKLRDYLATMRSGKPGYGHIRTAMRNGMPCHVDPFTGRTVFLLSEVQAWFKQRPAATRISDNAASAVRGSRRSRRG